MADADLLGIDVLLRIDGHLRALTDVDALFQRDPYPGGHRFFLGFEGPKVERLLTDLPSGRFKPPVEDLARRVLSSLGLFLQRTPRQGAIVLLNNVDDLLVERGRIHIIGVCSPILARVSNREDPLQVSGDIVNTRPSGTKPR